MHRGPAAVAYPARRGKSIYGGARAQDVSEADQFSGKRSAMRYAHDAVIVDD